jgi:chloramphenicol 3-O phosphotransferase
MYLREYTALSRLCGGAASGRQAILLNGPSSSGKSTLAKALQERIKEKRSEGYEVVSIDDFMQTDPLETIYEEDVFAVSGDLCKRVLEVLEAGSGVIIDHVITSERIFRQMKEMLHAYPLRLVHIICPMEVLRERERARGDRCAGSAETSAEYLFPKEGYDLTVDTGRLPAAEIASVIYERMFA